MVCLDDIEIENVIDILCLSEHQIVTDMENGNVSGYKIAETVSRSNNVRGGVTIYVKSYYSEKIRNKTVLCRATCACWLKLKEDSLCNSINVLLRKLPVISGKTWMPCCAVR